MEEDIGKQVLIENTTKLVEKGYEDIAHPILKSIGSIVSLPFKAIDAALTPIKKWIDKKNFNYEQTKKLLAQKLEKIDENQIVTPEPYVAVPAIQQLAYSYDSEDLRNLYANLLASAMKEDSKHYVHPSYVDIIKQLSPIDAKALNEIFTPDYLSIISVREYNNKLKTYTDLLNNYSMELDGIYLDYKDQSASLINLERLGLLKIIYGRYVEPQTRYDAYEENDKIKQIKETYGDDPDVTIDIKEGLIELTDFGYNFCLTCCDKKFVD